MNRSTPSPVGSPDNRSPNEPTATPRNGSAVQSDQPSAEEQPHSLGPTLDFLRVLWTLNHAVERTSKRMELTLGVTAQQRMLLRIVGKFPAITAGRLAQLLCVDAGTLSTALRRLEERGLLVRSREGADKRHVMVQLTAAGAALDRPTERTVEHAAETVLAAVEASDLEALKRVVERLVDALGQVEPRIT